MYRPRGESRSPRSAVGELRRAFGERPVGLGVSGVGVFLGLLTGVRMYLLPPSQWRFELGVVTALAGFTVTTGVALAVTDVPISRARRAESLCLKGLGVMGLSTVGLLFVGTPFEQGMATVLCLPDVLLTGGAVGGLGIGMLRRPRSEGDTDGSDDLRRNLTDGETGTETEAQTGTETETTATTEIEAEIETETEDEIETGTESEAGTETDQPRDGFQTIRLPVPCRETPESALDVWLEVLADPQCRRVLHYFTKVSGEVATVDELGTYLDGSGSSRSSRRDRSFEDDPTAALHHTVLPKLDDAGILDYDSRTRTVRYREQPTLEAWLAAVESFDALDDD